MVSRSFGIGNFNSLTSNDLAAEGVLPKPVSVYVCVSLPHCYQTLFACLPSKVNSADKVLKAGDTRGMLGVVSLKLEAHGIDRSRGHRVLCTSSSKNRTPPAPLPPSPPPPRPSTDGRLFCNILGVIIVERRIIDI